MNLYKTSLLTACLVALTASSSAQAAPVAFNVTTAALTKGTGYGASDQNKLDVVFTNTFSALSDSLTAVGDSFSFQLGTVDFNEQDITNSEKDNLGVSWLLSFSNPLAAGQSISATVTAALGNAVDLVTRQVNGTTCLRYREDGTCRNWNQVTQTITPEAIDYSLVWDAIEVSFGNGGKFSIDLDDLFFTTDSGPRQTQNATIKLLAAPQEQVLGAPNQVPEPGSMALLGLGLLGLVAARRKHQG